MVEVYVPFLLLMMSWNAEAPQDTMRVQQRLFLGQEQCEDAGREIDRLRAAEGDTSVQFAWKCVAPASMIEVRRPLDQAQ